MDQQDIIQEPSIQQPINTTSHPMVALQLILGAIIILFFGLVVGYYIGSRQISKQSLINNYSTKTVSPSIIPTKEVVSPTTVSAIVVPSNDTCVIEKNSILATVKTFEDFQEKKDPINVLNLFTPPQATQDISDYQNLSGKDDNIGPRLYNNVSTSYNTLSYKIIQEPRYITNNNCSVVVEEQRSNYGGPANPQYLPAATLDFNLILIKQNKVWMIDQYLSQDPKIKKGKYEGFLMEYSY